MRGELLHEVHYHYGALLLASPGGEPLGAVRALGLTADHHPGRAARLLLDVHRLQLGDESLRALGVAANTNRCDIMTWGHGETVKKLTRASSRSMLSASSSSGWSQPRTPPRHRPGGPRHPQPRTCGRKASFPPLARMRGIQTGLHKS